MFTLKGRGGFCRRRNRGDIGEKLDRSLRDSYFAENCSDFARRIAANMRVWSDLGTSFRFFSTAKPGVEMFIDIGRFKIATDQGRRVIVVRRSPRESAARGFEAAKMALFHFRETA